jgi:thiol-disulfide isomerase/thioredoxin
VRQNSSVASSAWKRWLLILFLATLAFAAGLALSVMVYGPQRLMSTPLGQAVALRLMPLISEGDRKHAALEDGEAFPADYLMLTDLNGAQTPLPGAGRTRLINYWASWCGPCVHEMPLLDAYAKSQTEVMVIGIALEPYQDAKAFADKKSLSFILLAQMPMLDDSSAMLGNTMGTLPYSALIDGEGHVLARQIGPFADQQQIEDWVQAAR